MEKIDVFVVGAGGTGSDVTYRLAGEGLSVVMAEREHLGGECSKFGCDPTKAMLKSARVAALARRAGEFGVRVPSVEVDFDAVMRRVRRLVDEETSAGASIFEERGARVFMQEARLIGEHRVELADGTVFDAGSVVLATGSVPSAPPIEGLERGGYWTNREAIWQTEGIPGSLLVLGSGAIGVEFAQIYSRFGAGVTVVEAMDRALPAEDEDSSEEIERVLRDEGIEVLTGARVTSAERTGEGWRLRLEGREPLEADRLLVATGRRPCFDGHDLEAAGIELDERGRPILTETLRTTNPRVWAGGDSTGELLFTHVGGYEAGVISADVLGTPFPRDYRVVPRVTFCEPEVASVGLTEADARDQGRTVVLGLARFSEATRAFLEGDPAGLVKVVADAETGEVLGAHIVGDHAGELIAEAIAAMAGRVPAGVIGAAIHPYPTLSEAVARAMREAGGASSEPD
jgi:pyruvate/2-oxoglutarate dehydrogenase complex dihydrolipoamide dehydrogenase (E3) component